MWGLRDSVKLIAIAVFLAMHFILFHPHLKTSVLNQSRGKSQVLFIQPNHVSSWLCNTCQLGDSFHLCLFDFPFIYQFYFLMTTLVKSAFWNPADLLIFKSFQQHFSIISKFVCCGFYIKKDVAFTLISFALMKWNDCSLVQLPFELSVQIPDQLHLELELNSN